MELGICVIIVQQYSKLGFLFYFGESSPEISTWAWKSQSENDKSFSLAFCFYQFKITKLINCRVIFCIYMHLCIFFSTVEGKTLWLKSPNKSSHKISIIISHFIRWNYICPGINYKVIWMVMGKEMLVTLILMMMVLLIQEIIVLR